MREWIRFKLTVLTPAFISGADQKESEFRAASVRGLLRWWWRATVGHLYALPELAVHEARIFGSTSEGLKSCVSVSVQEKLIAQMSRASRLPRSGQTYPWREGRSQDILPYLAYGPVSILPRRERHPDGKAKEAIFNDINGKPFKDPRFMRPAIAPGSELGVRLAWIPGRLTEIQITELTQAMCAWVSLGGLGSRSRKGWGLLEGQLESASTRGLLESTRQAWRFCQTDLQENGKPLPNPLPSYPQLAFRRIVKDSQSFERWEQALGSIGLKYKNLRPRGESRWIAGDADPRRASSLLISMIRGPDRKLRGLLCLLPCRRSGSQDGEREMRSFIQQLEER